MERAAFRNREEAGQRLADQLASLKLKAPVVYALPRGGVPVAAPIAQRLEAPLDLLLVRKIGVPGHEELAAGSIVDGERPDVVLNEEIVRGAGLDRAEIAASIAEHLGEIERRRSLYMRGRPAIPARGCTAIVVDDGVATGASMRAAIAAVKRRGPAAVVVATPVAPAETIHDLQRQADRVVCVLSPAQFGAVGYFYDDFHQISDDEVVRILAGFANAPP